MKRALLSYLRKFPIDFGKGFLEKKINLPITKEDFEYQSSNGLKYYLNLKDHVMRQIYLRDVYEKNTIRHIAKYVKPNMVFVDVGANIGAYTLNIGKLLTEGEVFSFEPNPRANRYLRKNIELNELSNIHILEKGLSDKEETVVLYTPSLTTASINKNSTSKETEIIELTTLDEFFVESRLKTIDVIKIDTEGHEMKCLKGAKETFKKNKKMMLVVEIDDNCLSAGYSKEELFGYITDMGFKAFSPKGYPFGKKEINFLPKGYADNVLFMKDSH